MTKHTILRTGICAYARYNEAAQHEVTDKKVLRNEYE
jgi:hypothetical protein